MNQPTDASDKPVLLKAVELLLAEPETIKSEALSLQKSIRWERHARKADPIVLELAAEKIISNYSYYSAFAGGATALAGVVPGLGTVAAAFGGATADMALFMKYQIEMTMALAALYGRDIALEDEKRLCMLVAGLGAVNEAAKEGGKAAGSKAFIKLAQTYLQGPTLAALTGVFEKLGLTFTRMRFEKAIPFGVGVIISFSANKGLTWYVGTRARDFYAAIASAQAAAAAPARA
jgi:uncharacterized protein (DUF697 family)